MHLIIQKKTHWHVLTCKMEFPIWQRHRVYHIWNVYLPFCRIWEHHVNDSFISKCVTWLFIIPVEDEWWLGILLNVRETSVFPNKQPTMCLIHHNHISTPSGHREVSFSALINSLNTIMETDFCNLLTKGGGKKQRQQQSLHSKVSWGRLKDSKSIMFQFFNLHVENVLMVKFSRL